MTGSDCTRRGLLKGSAAVGLTCLTPEQIVANSIEAQTATSDETQTNQSWEKLSVSNHPFSIRYRPGYEADAEKVRDWAISAHSDIKDILSFEIDEPFTFDIFPDSEWPRQHGDMRYVSKNLKVEMVTPSEYAGGYSDKNSFYRHGVTHEYVHAIQIPKHNFHTHAHWYSEGIAEAIAVYYTTEDIYDLYHNDHRRARETRTDIRRGFGHLMGVNEYVYRGSMHLIHFMIEKYGADAVGELVDQNAQSMVEAMEMRLGISPLDLEADWLEYAQREFGGDYLDELDRLGAEIQGVLQVQQKTSDPAGSVSVNVAEYGHGDYAIAVYDEKLSIVGKSETFTAGTRVEGLNIELDRQLAEPHHVRVKVVQTNQSGENIPVEIDGSELMRSTLYANQTSSVRFVNRPVEGQTSVTVNAFVDENYDTDENIAIRIYYVGDEGALYPIMSDKPRMQPGGEIIEIQVSLDENSDEVPLQAGQKIEMELIDFADDGRLASETVEVSAASASVSGNNSVQDLDGDGLHEDIDGDGMFSITDVQSLFTNRDSEAVQNNAHLFDFNKDGIFSVADIQRLFHMFKT